MIKVHDRQQIDGQAGGDHGFAGDRRVAGMIRRQMA